jgi:prophage regulatory protein
METLPVSGAGKLLRVPQVLDRLGCSRSTLYKMVRKGQFPQQMKIGEKISAWPEAQVERWLADRAPGEPTKQ